MQFKSSWLFSFQNHQEVCLKFPIECELKCGQDNIPRDMMEDHVTTHCPKAEHLCPFSGQGCHYRVSHKKRT